MLTITITNILLGFSLLKKEFSFSILKNRFLGHFYLVGSLVILFSIPTLTNEYNPYYIFYFLILDGFLILVHIFLVLILGKTPIASGFSKKSVEGFMGALAMSVITSILLFNCQFKFKPNSMDCFGNYYYYFRSNWRSCTISVQKRSWS